MGALVDAAGAAPRLQALPTEPLPTHLTLHLITPLRFPFYLAETPRTRSLLILYLGFDSGYTRLSVSIVDAFQAEQIIALCTLYIRELVQGSQLCFVEGLSGDGVDGRQ